MGPNHPPGNRRHIMVGLILVILVIHMPGNNVLGMTNPPEMCIVRIIRGIDWESPLRRLDLPTVVMLPSLTNHRPIDSRLLASRSIMVAPLAIRLNPRIEFDSPHRILILILSSSVEYRQAFDPVKRAHPLHRWHTVGVPVLVPLKPGNPDLSMTPPPMRDLREDYWGCKKLTARDECRHYHRRFRELSPCHRGQRGNRESRANLVACFLVSGVAYAVLASLAQGRRAPKSLFRTRTLGAMMSRLPIKNRRARSPRNREGNVGSLKMKMGRATMIVTVERHPLAKANAPKHMLTITITSMSHRFLTAMCPDLLIQ